MNNIDLILDSIKEDAENEAQDILSKAKKEGQELIEDRKKEAEKKAQAIILAAENQADLYKKNSEITANRQARDIKITAQNDVVKAILEKLKEKLKTISDKDYKKYVLKSLENIKAKDGQILLQEGKKELFKADELKGYKISSESVEEGFVVKSGKIEYDNRFSSLIDYKKDEFERQIIEEIFKWGD